MERPVLFRLRYPQRQPRDLLVGVVGLPLPARWRHALSERQFRRPRPVCLAAPRLDVWTLSGDYASARLRLVRETIPHA